MRSRSSNYLVVIAIIAILISQNINYLTYQSLGGRNDGNVVTAY